MEKLFSVGLCPRRVHRARRVEFSTFPKPSHSFPPRTWCYW